MGERARLNRLAHRKGRKGIRMIRRGRLLFIVVSLAVVAVMVGGSLLATNNRRDDGADSPYKYISMFVEVLDLVSRAYVDETDATVLMEGALEGATDALGPFALYVPADAKERFEQAEAVGTSRSGLTVLKERGIAFVSSVVPGSPGDEAGLERGDLIASLEGRATREMPLWEIHALLAGAPGTSLTLQRVRLGEQEDVAFELAEFSSPGVRLEAVRGVPVLELEALQASTPADVALSLATVIGEGAELPGLEKQDRLILDLRDLAGGDASVAYALAGLFVSGELGALVSRDETLETFANEKAPQWDGELTVLVNGGTQGAGEILATILEGQPNVYVVGQPTFGHSGRETLVPLSNGDQLRITTAFYTGPDRSPITESVPPDVLVRPRFNLDADSDRDHILEKAVALTLGEEAWPEVQKAA